MKYLVTRDDGGVSFWQEDTRVYLEDYGDPQGTLWLAEDDSILPVFDMEYNQFKELYKADIGVCGKRVMDIVVHYPDEE